MRPLILLPLFAGSLCAQAIPVLSQAQIQQLETTVAQNPTDRGSQTLLGQNYSFVILGITALGQYNSVAGVDPAKARGEFAQHARDAMQNSVFAGVLGEGGQALWNFSFQVQGYEAQHPTEAQVAYLDARTLGVQALDRAIVLEPGAATWRSYRIPILTLRSNSDVLPLSAKDAFSQVKEDLAVLTGALRYAALAGAAKLAVRCAALDDAQSYAIELLSAATNPKDWNYGNAVFFGNMVQGQVALRRGDLAAGQPSSVAAATWYAQDGRECFQPENGQLEPVAAVSGHTRIADFRRSNGVVRSNAGASLVDLGDGIGCIELHSLKNAIGGDVLALASAVLNPSSDAVRDFAGFVIASDRENFCVGANLMQLLLVAQEGEWEELAAVIHGFQQMTAAIKFCPRPVVAAPFGLTLGGGAEICLHAARRQPHAETYIGLVEAGVGLIPAGGGTKEMLLRAVDQAVALAPPDPRDPPSRFAQSAEMATALRRTFETIALAKVSTSAAEARSLGLLAPADRITMNRERLLLDAKAQAAALAGAGYTAPQPRTQIPAPGTAALATLETGVFLMGEAGYASEHDQKVARWAAYILAGGRVTAGSPVTEQYLLDLEREAFLSLCGERKTQERIAFTLKTGKPLRN